MHEITLKVGSPHALRDHIAEAVIGYSQGSNIRHTLEDLLTQVVDQLPDPAVAEPTEFGSIVRAGYALRPNLDRQLWLRVQVNYWQSESGLLGYWPELTDVEVLRVGLGEDSEAFNDGMREMNAAIHQKVRSLLAEAITGERKNAFEKAIQAVEELAP